MSSTRQPHISADSFFHTSSASDPSLSPITIYMISGNPGLIGYYHTFLSTLSDKLNTQSTQQTRKNHAFQIYGHSLGGFELTKTPGSEPRYYDLEEQICFVQNKLDDFLTSCSNASNGVPIPRPKVILIGHSVGSYIAMEILRRHRERSTSSASPSVDFDIIGGVMLFPTVVDIAKSPSGQKLTLAVVVGFLVRILTALLPGSLLRSLVRSYMGSPQDNMVETTAAFLECGYGVQQALHMAADEMQTITSDKWSDDVWGMSNVKDPVTRLFFYFGRNDHWVAERTRDEVIELRGRTEGGPKMVVCEEGLPHAFVLKYSDVVAKKVAGMVLDIVKD
ncbi:hypothetical protein BDV27DRAFT_148905 [Aspergillus caelatus]|uniref:Alpha/Beta hydrolase protein n=1 Tax=Aspergillus caelatus TaxID=61420 RepID=A0A5N6ZV92_9EURO|nr:uncharacterized protein BDV27DRAFT_148905 [Aspergillus caelatus]KAE8360190.1 hypothetical protein BDV27DRAFT_148905 [Aspergillus caelatus]